MQQGHPWHFTDSVYNAYVSSPDAMVVYKYNTMENAYCSMCLQIEYDFKLDTMALIHA